MAFRYRSLLDWRIDWYRGLIELAAHQAGPANEAFDRVYDILPGELAPKLALAFTAGAAGDQMVATRYFRLVLTVDRSFVSAAFGLARSLPHAGETDLVDLANSVRPSTWS